MSRSQYARQIAGGAIALLALTGCSSAADAPEQLGDSTETPAPEAPAESSVTVPTTEQLEEIFTSTQFDPAEFESGEEMFAAIYPGISASAACLDVLGITAPKGAASTAFSPSGDHTLTAQLSSFESGAEDYFAQLGDSADRCIADPQVTYQGQPLDVTVERVDDGERAFRTILTGTMNGQEISVRGHALLNEQSVLTIAGWDPKTNETWVPSATAQFLEKLRALLG